MILRLFTSIHFIVSALVSYFFACVDIFDYLDVFLFSVNQCIVTSNSTWIHFGDYSGTCGECTVATFVDNCLSWYLEVVSITLVS